MAFLRDSLRICVLVLAACHNTAEKNCFDGEPDAPGRIGACAQACDQGNDKACTMMRRIGDERCFQDGRSEACRWMCLYGRASNDAFCMEHLRLTGKRVR